jgi:hypothetical protein
MDWNIAADLICDITNAMQPDICVSELCPDSET